MQCIILVSRRKIFYKGGNLIAWCVGKVFHDWEISNRVEDILMTGVTLRASKFRSLEDCSRGNIFIRYLLGSLYRRVTNQFSNWTDLTRQPYKQESYNKSYNKSKKSIMLCSRLHPLQHTTAGNVVKAAYSCFIRINRTVNFARTLWLTQECCRGLYCLFN